MTIEKRGNVGIVTLAKWFVQLRRECLSQAEFERMIILWAQKLTDENACQSILKDECQ